MYPINIHVRLINPLFPLMFLSLNTCKISKTYVHVSEISAMPHELFYRNTKYEFLNLNTLYVG